MPATERWQYVALLCVLTAVLLWVTQTHAGLTLRARQLDEVGTDRAGVGSHPQSPAAQPDDPQPEHVPATPPALRSGLEGRA